MTLRTSRSAAIALFAVLAAVAVIGCSAPAATITVTVPPPPSDPPIAISAPSEVTAGATFKVGWTGTETSGDFFVIVPAGATTWTETAESPYVNATVGNPATLTAPKVAGAYEVWFMKGNMGKVLVIKARSPITVR